MKFLDYCNRYKVLIAVYPPHSTHKLQPLDVSLFRPLASYYSTELDQWLAKTNYLCRITKRDFWVIFKPAFDKAFSQKNIESGWKQTGLFPFDLDVIITIL
jgi:hypothetical protein